MEFFRARSRFLIQHFKWIRIQSGSRVLMTKNWRKNSSENFLYLFLIKNCNLITYVQATGEAVSHQREHPALRLWVIFALLDPDTDPGTPLNPDPQHGILIYFFAFRPGIFLPSSRRGTRLKQWARWSSLSRGFLRCRWVLVLVWLKISHFQDITVCVQSSVEDPEPQGPHVFGPTGSETISQRYGSGSFRFLIKVLSGLK